MNLITGLARPFNSEGTGKSIESLSQQQEFYDFSAINGYYTIHQRDMANQRMARYKEMWSVYDGSRFERLYENKAKAFAANYAKIVVNKIVDWMSMAGWHVETAPGNESLKGLLDYIWRGNRKSVLCHRVYNTTSVAGDAYMMVSLRTKDILTNEQLPPNEQVLEIKLVDPMYVHPIFNPADQTIIQCIIQYPFIVDTVMANRSGGSVKVGDAAHYTLLMRSNEILEYVNSTPLGEPKPNMFGRVPIVHIPNYLRGTSIFGLSDIEDVYDLNVDYNDIGHRRKKVVDYFVEPITLVFGTKMGNIIRGSDKIWSNFPKEARVENLSLQGDSTFAKDMQDLIRDDMHRQSNTPKTSVGETQEVTNLTRAGLSVQYMPLLEKFTRKTITHAQAFRDVNELILYTIQSVFKIDLATELGLESPNQLYDNDVVFGSPFPEDEESRLNVAQRRQQLGLTSRAQLLREQNYRNQRKVAMEIMADRRADMLMQVEQSQAAEGNVPNLTATVIDSIAVDNKLTEAFLAQDAQIEESMELAKEYRAEIQAINQQQLTQQQLQQAEDEREQQLETEELKKEAADEEGSEEE